MKTFYIACAIGLAVVVGGWFIARQSLGEYQRAVEKLAAEYRERASELRATNERYAWKERSTLDAKRFAIFVDVRRALARALGERLEEQTKSEFHARGTRNEVLGRLAEELDERRMSLDEYVATAARWRALLARDEFRALRAAWRGKVFNKEHPKGLPLPPPAKDASEQEIALVRKHAPALEETLLSDLLSPLLEEIVRNTVPDTK